MNEVDAGCEAIFTAARSLGLAGVPWNQAWPVLRATAERYAGLDQATVKKAAVSGYTLGCIGRHAEND